MAKINILSKNVYNQISAGEVVERPQSIVKELFENSIDAGAKNITVGIENGGINSIFIQDDGCGIEKTEIEKVFMPHATSKIKDASDLNTILSLGFRGEAMSSIASVSKVKLVSKTENDELASSILIEGGEIVEKGEEPSENGTKITVTGIFYNTPARLKFLKTPKTEELEITSLMEKLILANPNVAVKYFVNSKLVFQSYGDGLKGALIAVYTSSIIENCNEISATRNGVKVEGFLGKINFFKSNKSYQTVVVNGRVVVDSTISSAVFNAYSTYLMKRQYPFYVLNIQVPPEVVDVNVHPRKTEIRFQNNQVIYGSLFNLVSKVLDGSSEVLEIIRKTNSTIFPDECYEKIKAIDEGREYVPVKSEYEIMKETMPFPKEEVVERKIVKNEIKQVRSYIDNNGKRVYLPYDKTLLPNYKSKSDVSDHKITTFKADYTSEEFLDKMERRYGDIDDIFAENKRYLKEQEEKQREEDETLNYFQPKLKLKDELEFVGLIFSTYLLFEKGDDFYVVDQHAAHEHIVFEKVMEKVKNRKVVRQQLLVPYCVTFNAKEQQMFLDIIDYLYDMGFDIEEYGENSCRIFAIPSDLVGLDIEKFFYDIISDTKFKEEKIPTLIKEKLMQKACKAAIKAGDMLSLEEIQTLMDRISLDYQMKCPHGRPVLVKIKKSEIDKWFKRIV